MAGMIKCLCLGLVALAGAAPAAAFDYYVLALSWTPSYCAAEGDARDAEQCDPGRDLGFTMHGLWPQYEVGWPEYCDTDARDPSRAETGAMADVMGSGGLAWYQWKKHGRCSGLDPADYFARARVAYDALRLPENGGSLSHMALEDIVLQANPDLSPDAVIVTCRGDLLREVRLCLTPDLAPRRCGSDVLEDACRYRGALDLPPVR